MPECLFVELAQLRALLELVPEMRVAGVKRVRLGDAEIELGEKDFILIDAAVPDEKPAAAADLSKCSVCQVAPLGRIMKGLCRTCALSAAGVSFD